MGKKTAVLIAIALFTAPISRADFKYNESSKITGGMMSGMMKVMGAFSKDAKRATEPIITTTYFKGNSLRRDQGDGTVEIIDLDGRRIIHIDPKKRAYSVMTFEEMRAALEKARAQMAEKTKEKNANVKFTPKFDINPTGKTQVILGQETQEVNIKVNMEMQAEDPTQQQAMQGASFVVTSDSWIAPAITGYGDVHRFYVQMAKELDWLPQNISFGGDPRMANALAELQKGGNVPIGLPLLQYTSLSMAGMPQAGTAGTAPSGGQAPSSGQAQSSPDSSDAAAAAAGAKSATAATAVSALSHLGFGGFGKKKKKDQPAEQAEQPAAGQPPTQAPSTAPSSGSLMDISVQVTSFSTDSLDGSLFEIPSGYTQVQESAEHVLGGGQH
jgi:hypothetical protein